MNEEDNLYNLQQVWILTVVSRIPVKAPERVKKIMRPYRSKLQNKYALDMFDYMMDGKNVSDFIKNRAEKLREYSKRERGRSNATRK